MSLEALRKYAAEKASTGEATEQPKGGQTAPPRAETYARKNTAQVGLQAALNSVLDVQPAAIMKMQADYIRKSEAGRAELAKGMTAGEEPLNLFLQAVAVIGQMTGEETVLKAAAKEYAARKGR